MQLGPRLNFLLGLAWVAFFILASFVYRRLNDKYIFRPHFADPLYKESRASGRSLRTFYTRWGGANGCLWITVAGNSLNVGPHFPFTLMFLPEVYGLEYSIPAENIISVEKIEHRFGKPSIRIAFRRDASDEESFEITSRRTDELLAALDRVRSKRTHR